MADWGAISGVNAAGGFLQGFAQTYGQAARDRALLAAHQQQQAFQMFAKIMADNPSVTTNPAFHNAIMGAGLDETSSGALLGAYKLISGLPEVQQRAKFQEMIGDTQGDILNQLSAPVSAGELTGQAMPGGGFAGPSLAQTPAGLPSADASAVRRSRISALPAREAALAFAPDKFGSILASEATEGITPNAAAMIAERQKDRALRDRQQQRLEQRGVTEVRETPVGGRPVRVVTDPETGEAVVKAGPLKRAAGQAAEADTMRNVGAGLRLYHSLQRDLKANPAEIQRLFVPFVGKPLDKALEQSGNLTPRQVRFLKNLNEFKNLRITAKGGKQLTITEKEMYEDVLPNLAVHPNALAETLATSAQQLTEYGATTETVAEQSGRKVAKTPVFSWNRAVYKNVRAPGKRSFQKDKQVPLYPGERLEVATPGGGMAGGPAPAAAAQAELDDFELLLGQ